MNKILNISSFGVTATAIYLAIIAWLRWPFSIQTLRVLHINELGDFLAGVFGPLALFWFILAFFLQKAELRQNRDAFLLQAKELRDTLHQHEELVATSKKQLEADLKANELQEIQLNKEIQPRFTITNVGKVEKTGEYNVEKDRSEHTGIFIHTVEFLNDGAPAANLTFMSHLSDRALATAVLRNHYINTGEKIKISWELEDEGLPNKATVTLHYFDTIEREQSKEFFFELTEEDTYKSTKWNYGEATEKS